MKMTMPLETFEQAQKLAERYRDNDAFRDHVQARRGLIAPAAVVILGISIAYAASAVVLIGGTRAWLVLPALLLAPCILIGSAFVHAYLFASWVESRALARALGQQPRLRDLSLPSWVLLALFLAVPLAMLALLSWKGALLVVLLAAVTPALYAWADR